MAQQDAPLSSLCSICYTNPPKYVCPRDHVRTCSLPCYKRHQQRASCDGKRDPTAYMRKEQLSTAAGIDHDYNFLSGVDRVFDKADRQLEERGIGQADHSLRKRWHFDGPLQKYLRANQILIDRAPVGMSRQKANQTRYVQKSKRIVWTVEWIKADGSKRMSEVHEAASIGEAYSAMLADKERESKKRKLEGGAESSSKTAKIGDGFTEVTAGGSSTSAGLKAANDASLDPSNTSSQWKTVETVPNTLPPDVSAPSTSLQEPTPITQIDQEPTVSDEPSEITSATTPETEDTRTLILSRIHSEQSRQASIRASKLPTGPPFFYLLRPHTSATSRVLIPLSADQSLTTSLALRIVLEFPTIYVLNHGQDDLPAAFTTEEAYLRTRQEEDREVEELLRAVPNAAASSRVGAFGERAAVQGADSSELDPSKILEMLKRDVPS